MANQQLSYQTADGTILQQPKIEGQKTQEFPTFYTSNGNATINLAQLTGDNSSLIAESFSPRTN